MNHLFYAADGDMTGGLRFGDVEPPPQVPTDWNIVGLKVAFGGAIFPLLLAACLAIGSAASVWWLDGPTFNEWAHRAFVQVITPVVAGLPFILFGCFILSTMIAVPLVTALSWVSSRVSVRVSPTWPIAIGVAFIGALWTGLFFLFSRL